MRARYLALVFLIAIFAIPTYAGFVYYVNGVSGNDASPGTQAAPWKTIQKSANTLQIGDTVIVSAGTYPERVTLTRSGTSGSMISYAANGTVSCQGFTVKADFVQVKGFKVTATQPVWTDKGYGIWVEGKFCIIDNNYAYYSPRGGIMLLPSSSNCIVRNNRCHRNGMSGIEINGSNHLVENNEIWGSIVYHTPTNLNNGDADGFRFFGSGHIFRGNFIHDITYDDPENQGYSPHIDGFQTWSDQYHSAASNILLEKNFIYLPVYKDGYANGHGFMLATCSYITIRNNIVITHGGVETGGGNVDHLKIQNNTFVGSLSFIQQNFPNGMNLSNCPYSTVKNNIVYNQASWAIHLDGTTFTGLDIGYNCVYNSDGTMPGGIHYPHDLWGVNPLFENAGNYDYHLKAASPCKDAGASLPDITDDYDNNPRPSGAGYDMGIYELQVGASPSITGQPQSQTIQSSQTANLSVTAEGASPLAYQWYRGTSGSTSDPISGATSSSYPTPALTQTTNYWVRVSNTYGTADSNAATITVNPPRVSGSVKTTDGQGIEGVVLTLSGSQGSATTDASGNYSSQVTSGWSGTVTPQKTGYSFSPSSRSYTNVTLDRTGEDYTASLMTFAISGSVKTTGGQGVAGVTLTFSGGQGSATTDSNGNYSCQVTSAWSGSVTPQKTGCTFSPSSRSYTNVTSDKANENYTTSQTIVTISGAVNRADGQSVAGVTLTFSGGQGTATTDAGGNYSNQVISGWSGTATPQKTGCTFSPSSRSYTNVTSDKTNENYTASQTTVTTSGTVKTTGGQGVAGVILTFSGGQGTAITDANGYYSSQVTSGWSGSVTPEKTGYNFSPSSRSYTNVTSDETGEDYTVSPLTFTISGSVKTAGGQGIEGVVLTFSGGLGTATTDADGNYSQLVNYGWSGTVTPSKTNTSLFPFRRRYMNVSSAITGQDYTALATRNR